MTSLLRMGVLCLVGVLMSPLQGRSADAISAINVLIAYHSLSGHTEQMAKAVAEGTRSISSVHVTVKRVQQVTAEDLFSADAIILGSPVYWSNMAGARRPGPLRNSSPGRHCHRRQAALTRDLR